MSPPDAPGSVRTVWTICVSGRIYVTLDERRRAVTKRASWGGKATLHTTIEKEWQLGRFYHFPVGLFPGLCLNVSSNTFCPLPPALMLLLGRHLETTWYFWAQNTAFSFFFSSALRCNYTTAPVRTLNIDLARWEVIEFHVRASKLRLNYHRLTQLHVAQSDTGMSPRMSRQVSPARRYIEKIWLGLCFMGP